MTGVKSNKKNTLEGGKSNKNLFYLKGSDTMFV
jgi:hypothetical protein